MGYGRADESFISPCLSSVCVTTLQRLDLGPHFVNEAQLRQMMRLTNLSMVTLGGLALTSNLSECKTPWKIMALVDYEEPFADLANYPVSSLTLLAFAGSSFCFNLTNSVKAVQVAVRNLTRVTKMCFGTPCKVTTYQSGATTTETSAVETGTETVATKSGTTGAATTARTKKERGTTTVATAITTPTIIDEEYKIRWKFSPVVPSSEVREMVVAVTSAVCFAHTAVRLRTLPAKAWKEVKGSIEMDLRNVSHMSSLSVIAKWASGHIAKVHTDSLALVGPIPPCRNTSKYLVPPDVTPKELKTAPPTPLLKALRLMEGVEDLYVTLPDLTKEWRYDLVYITRTVVQSLVINQPARHLIVTVFPPPPPEGKCHRDLWPEIWDEADVIDRRIERASEVGIPGFGMYVETDWADVGNVRSGNFWWWLDIVEDRYNPNADS